MVPHEMGSRGYRISDIGYQTPHMTLSCVLTSDIRYPISEHLKSDLLPLPHATHKNSTSPSPHRCAPHPSPFLLLAATVASAQQTLPLRQSKLDSTAADPRYSVPLDSTSDGRWLGGGATLPRWDVAGQWAYFQFALDPKPVVAGTVDDPWWRVSRDGKRVEPVEKKDALLVPANVQYTRDAKRGFYFLRGELRYWKQGTPATKVLLARNGNIFARWSDDEKEIRFADNQQRELYGIDPEAGTMRQITSLFTPAAEQNNKMKDELKKEQNELFDFLKKRKADRDTALARQRRDSIAVAVRDAAQGQRADVGARRADERQIRDVSRVRPPRGHTATIYVDYVTESGFAEQRTSRPKVGDSQAQNRLAIVKADPYAIPDSVKITWVDTSGFGKAGEHDAVSVEQAGHASRRRVPVDGLQGSLDRAHRSGNRQAHQGAATRSRRRVVRRRDDRRSGRPDVLPVPSRR